MNRWGDKSYACGFNAGKWRPCANRVSRKGRRCYLHGGPGSSPDRCRIYEVDGTEIRVRGKKPMSKRSLDALAGIVRAAYKMFSEKGPTP